MNPVTVAPSATRPLGGRVAAAIAVIGIGTTSLLDALHRLVVRWK